MAKEPWADPARIVLVGKSTGGFAVAAASGHDLPGVIGVVDVAGGRGADSPDEVCQAEGLVNAMAAFGRDAHVPSLWIFALNDHYFGPQLAQRMFDAYTAQGAPAQLAMLPSFGTDGHDVFDIGPSDLWWPTVASFLDKLDLPTQLDVSLPPMQTLTSPPGLLPVCASLFTTYAASRTMGKAYVLADGGRCFVTWTGRTAADAAEGSMAGCSRRQMSNCRVYAQGASVP